MQKMPSNQCSKGGEELVFSLSQDLSSGMLQRDISLTAKIHPIA